MDIKLMLVKSITLLFHESYLEGNKADSKPIIKQALEYVKMPESPAGSGIERNALVLLRVTLLWMISNNDSQPYDRDDLLQRIKVNCADDEKLYEAFLDGLIIIADPELLRRKVNGARRALQGFISREKAKDILRKASHQAAFKGEEIEDWSSFLAKTTQELNKIDMGGDIKVDPAFTSSIDFSNENSVLDAFQEMEDSLSDDGIVAFPFKGLNRMMGEQAGGRRGELALFPALPHNYKSGILMDIFLGACLFNNPYLFDKTKKPTIVFYSTEDDVPVIIKKIYVLLKQIETGLPINTKRLNMQEATKYVMERLTARGWHVHLFKVRPSLMTYRKLFAHLDEFKANGHEVAIVVCDYLGMFSKEGCNQGSTGDDVQDLYRRVREYTNSEKIFFATAHQLSTEAKSHSRMKPDDWLLDMPGKGYYEGCKKIDTEVDFECYVNKRVVANGTFLEFLWGKHRKVGATPQKYKYFCMKFNEEPMYGLPYDVAMEEDLSYTVVGGKRASDGGGKEWFDIN